MSSKESVRQIIAVDSRVTEVKDLENSPLQITIKRGEVS